MKDSAAELTYEQWRKEHFLIWGPRIVKSILDNIERNGPLKKIMVWGNTKEKPIAT